jgi:hypothetical protein
VGELLECFVPRRSTTLWAEEPASLAVGCTDADAAWLLGIDAEGVTTHPAPSMPAGADCSVRGRAADLYLALWNRTGPVALAIEGDRAVLSLFLDQVHVRWS